MDLMRVCRLCGQDTDEKSRNIFEKNGNGKQIVQLIKQYIPILVYRTDPLSKRICENCYVNLTRYSEFLTQCVNTQEYFQNDLSTLPQKNVQLYLNAIENFNTEFLASLKTCNKVKIHVSCQVETKESNTDNQTVTKTEIVTRIKRKNVTVLTPEIINKMSPETKYAVTSATPEGIVLKKRKLIGPKSKMLELKANIKNPLSLLQCALKQINRDISLDNTYKNFVFEPIDIDLTVPVICNYCMKEFNNIIELAKHEKNHIIVDIGPRVENKLFGARWRTYYNLYLAWRTRMEAEKNQTYDTYEDTSQNESSLLVPGPTEDRSEDAVFKVVDGLITVNGKPLQDYDKTERRLYYKSIVVDGVKRKFCPICRHTFKDNWAIDVHYINSSCQYTCKYCGLKFKFHKDLYPEHLKTHEGEPCTKIFGPTDKKSKIKKRKIFRQNMYGGFTKISHTKIQKQIQRRAMLNQIKSEASTSNNLPERVDNTGGIQPYQAYFCRKCFKVFFKIDEFNAHTNLCKGTSTTTEPESLPSEHSKSSESEIEPVHKRPVRSCVKELSLNDSDTDSFPGNWSPVTEKDTSAGFECGICCSSFPSRQSRNSHMRIHKGQKVAPDKLPTFMGLRQSQQFIPKPALRIQEPPKSTLRIQEPPKPALRIQEPPKPNTSLAALDPTVARLVQNNPHLTIRSYKKADNPSSDTSSDHSGKNGAPVMGYRCADCNMRCPNKSLLYYHKMNKCVVKREYECGFCRKKFGGQEQYNLHMLHVHPE